MARDAVSLGGLENARALYEQRYHAACRRYLTEVAATRHATFVIDHADQTTPTIIKAPPMNGRSQ